MIPGKRLVMLFLPALLISESCKPIGQHFYSKVTVDRNLNLSVSGSEIYPEPVSGEYYSIFYAANLNGVDHINKRSATQRERLLLLETNPDSVITRTVKEDAILEGPFGTIYVSKECRFEGPEENYWSSVSVGGGKSRFAETPSSLSDWPKDTPPLTSLSLIRILRLAEKHLIVSGNYEANGQLGSLDLYTSPKAEKNTWRVTPKGNNYSYASPVEQLIKRYGIPDKIDLSEYLQKRSLGLPSIPFEREKTLGAVVYGFDTIIRLDELSGGSITSSKYFRPSITEEEKVLNSLCDKRFEHQRSLSLPTVQ